MLALIGQERTLYKGTVYKHYKVLLLMAVFLQPGLRQQTCSRELSKTTNVISTLFSALSPLGPFCTLTTACPISPVGIYPHPHAAHDHLEHPEWVTELRNTSGPASSACVKLDSCLYPVTNKHLASLGSSSLTQLVSFIHMPSLIS